MSALELFRFESHEIRTLLIDDAPHFVAADICATLGYEHTPSAIRRLDADEYRQAALPQVAPNVRPVGPPARPMTVVNEPGLYSLILWSQKPEAKAFKRWVTHEVLPSIRRTGGYGTAPPAVDPVAVLQELMAKAARTDAAEAKLAEVAALLGIPTPAPQPAGWYPSVLPPPLPTMPTFPGEHPDVALIEQWVRTCTGGHAFGTPGRQLYRAFQTWCEEQHRTTPTEARFGRALTELGFPSWKTQGNNQHPDVTVTKRR